MTEQQHLLAAHTAMLKVRCGSTCACSKRARFASPRLNAVACASTINGRKSTPYFQKWSSRQMTNAYCLVAVVCRPARRWLMPLANCPIAKNQVVRDGASTLWFEHPAERFLLVTDVATANMLTEKLATAKPNRITANSGWHWILKQAFGD